MNAARFDQYDFSAILAADNFYPIARRIEALLRQGRTMVWTHRFADRNDRPSSLDIVTDATLSTECLGEPLQYGHLYGLSTVLQFQAQFDGRRHCGVGFGVRTGTTEHQMRQRWDSDDPRDVTRINLQGWPEGRGREDRISIARFNEHGVLLVTDVAFM